jgi:phospholipid/cholesterol/gamma-HCH transport system substrate-binding protein
MKIGLGFMVMSAAGALALVAYLTSSMPDFLTAKKPYTVILSDASGVSPGTPVRRSGVRIGEVRTISLDEDTGEVRIAIVIESPHTIHNDLEPVLNHNLLGDTTIDFTLKPPAKPVLAAVDGEIMLAAAQVPAAPDRSVVPPGSTIPGKVPPSPQTLLPSAQESLNEVRKAAESFNKMAPTLDDAAGQIRDLARDVRQAVPDLRRTNDEALVAIRNWGAVGERANVLLRTNEDKINESVDNANEALKNVRAASTNFESISKNTDAFVKESRNSLKGLDEAIGRFNAVLKDLEGVSKPLGARGDHLVRNLDESSEKLNRTLTDVVALMRVLGEEDGTVQRLLKDPSLYNHLDDVACNLAKMMPQLDRILHDVAIFADKIARHPESLGVGGVVRPGSGIK